MTTCEPLSNGGETDPPLTLFAADTPASRSARPGTCVAPKIPGTSGPPSQTSFAQYDPAGHCWRTSQLTLDSDSPGYSPTLPASGSMRNGALYQRPRWVHPREGPDCSFWPTPKAQNDAGGVGYQQSRQARGTTTRWPTLTGAARIAAGRPMQSPGLLNPTWVEWLMGFPPGWTDCDFTPSATRPSRRSPSTSAG